MHQDCEGNYFARVHIRVVRQRLFRRPSTARRQSSTVCPLPTEAPRVAPTRCARRRRFIDRPSCWASLGRTGRSTAAEKSASHGSPPGPRCCKRCQSRIAARAPRLQKVTVADRGKNARNPKQSPFAAGAREGHPRSETVTFCSRPAGTRAIRRGRLRWWR